MAIQNKKRQNCKSARLPIVALGIAKGLSLAKIAQIVKEELRLDKAPTAATIMHDRNTLLEQWQEEQLKHTESRVTAELVKIDYACDQLWDAWEKSKTDHKKNRTKQKGAPPKKGDSNNEGIKTFFVEKEVQDVVSLGNPAYIAEIRQQQAERRKLLGLYAPEKQEVTGKDGEPLMKGITVRVINSKEELAQDIARHNEDSQ